MPQYTLTVLDVTGIQDYIFGSNRVPENIGASELVHQATHTWIRESLPDGCHNLNDDDTLNASRRLEEDNTLEVEVVLRGGGNVLILFRSAAIAKASVGKLTRRLLTDAPGLEIAAAHHSFEWSTPIGGQNGAHHELYKALNRVKQQRCRSAPLLGMGVTVECRATGMSAVDYDEKNRPVSAAVKAKIGSQPQAAVDERFDKLFGNITTGYTFRKDFDALGRSAGEMSYIAVVHADGNGMGKRFKAIIDQYPHAVQNRDCLEALRNLSEAVDRAGKTALCATVGRMLERFKEQNQALLHGLRDRSNNISIPFRPIVYGGDDVTFVCDGRLGLSLAAIYLEEWERATAADVIVGKAYACAGIAVVKSHYPFVRAYNLAEDLCKGAKQSVRTAQRSNPSIGDASALDWHFAVSGIAGSIAEIRDREYTLANGNLTTRPLTLTAPILTPTWYTWAMLDRVIREFQDGKDWRERRNKVKELREVLRQGGTAVQQFRHAFSLPNLPMIDASHSDLQTQGWVGNYCGYFDAIEALDFYLPLTEVR